MNPAPISRRLSAGIISTLPLTAYGILMTLVVMGAPPDQRAPVAMGLAVIATGILIIWAITSAVLIHRRGGGIATRRLGLEITATDGTRLSLGRALRRQLGCLILFPVVMGGAGAPGIIIALFALMAPALWREDGRGLHDLLSGSIVVQAEGARPSAGCSDQPDPAPSAD